MTQRLFVRISPDGRIEAETIGMEGATCMPYMELLENWLEAEVIESARLSTHQSEKQKTTLMNQLGVSEHGNH